MTYRPHSVAASTILTTGSLFAGGGKDGRCLAEASAASTTNGSRSLSKEGKGVLGDGIVDSGDVIGGVLTSCHSTNGPDDSAAGSTSLPALLNPVAVRI